MNLFVITENTLKIANNILIYVYIRQIPLTHSLIQCYISKTTKRTSLILRIDIKKKEDFPMFSF